MRSRPVAMWLAICITVGGGARPALAQCANLAIGAPHDNAGAAGAGAVNVLYGTEAGLSSWGEPALAPERDWRTGRLGGR